MNPKPQYPANQPGQNRPVWNEPPTIPVERIEMIQPVRVRRRVPVRRRRVGCLLYALLLIPFFLLIGLLGVYLLAPMRTDLLVLGIDRVPEGTALGRSDTMILVSVNPLRPDVGLISIPRDLWVTIPGVGENRINTAHFFAEANEPGSGPAAALETVNQNFGLDIKNYVRLRFDAFQRIVDALGGVTLNLSEDMGGLPAGKHHLDGTQALAFVRDRKGTDDFYRMQQGQVMLRAVALQALSPLSWPRLPGVFVVLMDSVDTNLPIWQWPRLGLAVARASLSGLDSRSIQREMVTPYTTDGGAQVLLPNWDLILPMVDEVFKR